MKYKVHKCCQSASGGSHVTIYDADLEFTVNRGDIQVILPPGQEAAVDVQEAAEAIKKGAETALTPRGVGAIIKLSRVVIHMVDFKPRKFEQYTTEELDRICEGGLL
jgi:hypothetical protein